MIADWLKFQETSPSPYGLFRIIDFTEKKAHDTDVIDSLGSELIHSYRNLEELKFRYKALDPSELVSFIKNYVIPTDTYQLAKNVRQGDFGEVLASLIVSYFYKLVVPIHKMRYKFNKDRSVFCTDMVAHNDGDAIKDLFYYEIKSRRNANKENVNGLSAYVTIHAHNSLLRDEQRPNEGIADFLAQRHFEKGEYDLAAKYGDIVKSPEKYNRSFELFFILEKDSYKTDILQALQDLPASLKPLAVTVVLIEGLQNLVEATYDAAIKHAVSYVYSK